MENAARPIVERYDREAVDYREWWAPVLRVGGLRLLREMDGPARRVLDMGTGVGTLLPELRLHFPGAVVAGVDLSRGMLALVPAEFPRAVMDATSLAIASGSMDRVVAAFMLFHLSHPVDGLREARRVLAARGEVGTITWGGELESRAVGIWTESLDAHGAAPLDPAILVRHEQVDTAAKMEKLLGEAGFGRARAWEEDLTVTLDADRLLALRTRLGSNKPRYDSLSPESQAACVMAARLAWSRLAPEEFVTRIRVVYAVGSV